MKMYVESSFTTSAADAQDRFTRRHYGKTVGKEIEVPEGDDNKAARASLITAASSETAKLAKHFAELDMSMTEAQIAAAQGGQQS